MQKKIKQFELFLKRSSFDRGIRLGVAIAIAAAVLYNFGLLAYAPAIAIGTLLNAPGDIPGSLKRKINAILVSIGLTMLTTALILFAKPFLPLLLLTLAVLSFAVSMISVYGFRASMVSFSGLLAMVLAFTIEKETAYDIFIQISLLGIGGLWYLLVSLIFQKLSPKKDQNQLLSHTLLLIGEYLELRAELLTHTSNRDELIKQSFVLQNKINEKHETLRETLLTERKRTGHSQQEEKQLLIFMSSVNIFELIEAKQLNYTVIDEYFGDKIKYLRASEELNKLMGNQLVALSEIMIRKGKIPSNYHLNDALDKALKLIRKYIDTIKLPAAREGALVLKNLYDYQEQLLQEIKSIQRVMANVNIGAQPARIRQDSTPFLTLQEYKLNILFQNFSLHSKMFRHALRFSIAMVFGYLLGFFFDFQNTYWILLTILVIMRPNYGLTKERSKDRIIGTLIGAAVAVAIVLLTQNVIVYGILAAVSLIFSFSLIQQNYKSAAALITISIVFLYSSIHPNSFEVIQFRVVDTIIGASIAVIANYLILPSWEADNLKDVFLNTLKMNKKYLFETQKLYQNKSGNKLDYFLARKEAFLAISNLNAAFQRLTQDPKSKQKEYQLIYETVTLNQTMISAIASIGNFISTHQTTEASAEFNLLIEKIANNLEQSIIILEAFPNENEEENTTILETNAETEIGVLLDKYQQLSDLRDENISKGYTELDTETLHELQEAFLIANQMNWLKTLSENLKKTTKNYCLSLADDTKKASESINDSPASV